MIRAITYATILTLIATPALAKCPYQARAKSFYQTGSKHYTAKNYRQALEAFNKAQKLCPTVTMLYNLARTNDLAGNAAAALMLYQEYLKLKDPKADPGDIQRRITALRAKPTADWTDPFEVTQTPKEIKPCPQPTDQATLLSTETPRHKRPWAWVATGTGVALLATGTALLATRTVNEWQRDDDGKLVSTTDSVAPGAALMAAGAVAAGIGVWLFVRGQEAQGSETGASVALSLHPTGTGVLLAGTF